MNRIIALWAVPRSVSTAFEQMIRTRGDFLVLSEPFSIYYYSSLDSVTNRYYFHSDNVSSRVSSGRQVLPKSDWRDVVATIEEASFSGSVFFKDMAYHLNTCPDLGFLSRFTNVFIIRHPRFAVASLLKLQPDSTFEEAGYYDQHKLMIAVARLTGEAPVVIDGQELRQMPEKVVSHFCSCIGIPYIKEALSWPAKIQKGWDPYWVADVAASRKFYPEERFDEGAIRRAESWPFYHACLELYQDMKRRGR